MRRLSRLVAAVLLATFTLAAAQGAAAVVTLEASPPAGDGHAALQSGSAIPAGVASAWYNPALLAKLRTSTGSNIHFTASEQDLIFSNKQDFSGVAIMYPGTRYDLGIAVFRNAIEFAPGNSEPPSPERDGESVYGLAAGMGVSRFLSVGLAVKYYQSEIGTAEATGWAFDAGLVASQRVHPLKKLPSLDVTPSLGVALRNLGPEAWYVDPEMSDPLPHTWSNGLGLQIDFADAAQITFAGDLEKPVHRHARWSDPWQKTYGYTASVLGFRYGAGWLRNPAGERFEKHVMREFEFNFQRLMKVWDRVATGDFRSESSQTVAVIPGTRVRANPRIVVGRREIVSGTRTGQDALYFSVSL